MTENPDVTAAAERTALAWQRTTIGVLAIGALLVRWSVVERFPLWPGIVLVTAAALASLILVRRRYQRVRTALLAAQTPLSRYLVPGATAVMLVLVAVVGAAMLVEYSRL